MAMKYWVGVMLLGVLVGCGMAQEVPEFTRPSTDEFDVALLDTIDLEALPVVPQMTDTALAIYAQGQIIGRDAQRFTKVGDCMTASEEFLTPFAADNYDLGDYGDLQAVIDTFSVPARDEADAPDSFGLIGMSTASGFNTASLVDSLFADPTFCDPNESSLMCEYRLGNAAFALVMLGTNDVMFFEVDDFDFAMRNIVLDTIEQGIVPILYTFPDRPEFPEKVIQFNRAIALIASDYDLPLVNLWLAIQDLPDKGVDAEDPIHLSEPADGNTGDLTTEGLQYGYNMRNLITLQTLSELIAALPSE